MAILKIARMGHPVLSKPAQPVPDPTAPEISRLVHDMVETLNDAGGVGLAAPQVHVPLRLVIFHVPAARAVAERYRAAGLEDPEEPDPELGPVPLTVLINPEVTPLGGEKMTALEACLSLPGMAGTVPRFERVRYSGQDQTGQAIERTARGFHARVVQHECDHLDGVLYPMRMQNLNEFGFAEELHQRLADAS